MDRANKLLHQLEARASVKPSLSPHVTRTLAELVTDAQLRAMLRATRRS